MRLVLAIVELLENVQEGFALHFSGTVRQPVKDTAAVYIHDVLRYQTRDLRLLLDLSMVREDVCMCVGSASYLTLVCTRSLQ